MRALLILLRYFVLMVAPRTNIDGSTGNGVVTAGSSFQLQHVVAASASNESKNGSLTARILRGKTPQSHQVACFADSRWRGFGKPLNSCANGHKKDGLLCYPECKAGYAGVGPVCWEKCPEGLQDHSFFCSKTYGKGCCCTTFGCCGCDRPGFTDLGCICSRTFNKHSYGRGAGKPMTCGPDQEKAGALCYNKCSANHVGVGPMCYGVDQPPTALHTKCNDLMWAVDEVTCNVLKKELGLGSSLSLACAGVAIGLALSVVGLPLASTVCGIALPEAINAINNVIDKTGAKACTS